MNNERCESCRFWGEPTVVSEDYGFCRRYPPIILQRITIDDGNLSLDLLGRSPEVSPNGWCGEWEPRRQGANQPQLDDSSS